MAKPCGEAGIDRRPQESQRILKLEKFSGSQAR
jgi:hypothetical protein